MSKIVISDKVYTPKEYLSEFINVNWLGRNMDRSRLREIIDGFRHYDLWDYPLSEVAELDKIITGTNSVVLVRFPNGEYRWFETGETVN